MGRLESIEKDIESKQQNIEQQTEETEKNIEELDNKIVYVKLKFLLIGQCVGNRPQRQSASHSGYSATAAGLDTAIISSIRTANSAAAEIGVAAAA